MALPYQCQGRDAGVAPPWLPQGGAKRGSWKRQKRCLGGNDPFDALLNVKFHHNCNYIYLLFKTGVMSLEVKI